MQKYSRRKKDRAGDVSLSGREGHVSFNMPDPRGMEPVDSPKTSFSQRYQAGKPACTRKKPLLDVGKQDTGRTKTTLRGSRKHSAVNYCESSEDDFSDTCSADLLDQLESANRISKKHSKKVLPFTDSCSNGTICKPKWTEAASSKQWPLPIDSVLKGPRQVSREVPPTDCLELEKKKNANVSLEGINVTPEAAAPLTPFNFAPQAEGDEGPLREQDCNKQSGSVRKPLPEKFTKSKRIKDDLTKAERAKGKLASRQSGLESDSGDEYTPSTNNECTTDEESAGEIQKVPRLKQPNKKKTGPVDRTRSPLAEEDQFLRKHPSKRTKTKAFGSTMAVSLRPQAIRSFEEGDRIILELPQSFDVDGDAGAIGRFSASSKAEKGLVFDLKGTIYDGQILPACGSLCVANLTGDKAEIEYMTNTFVRLEETWTMDDAERILEGTLSADEEDCPPQKLPSEKKANVAKLKTKGKAARGLGRHSAATKA